MLANCCVSLNTGQNTQTANSLLTLTYKFQVLTYSFLFIKYTSIVLCSVSDVTAHHVYTWGHNDVILSTVVAVAILWGYVFHNYYSSS